MNKPDKTGLLLDPYFSATKAIWLLKHIDGARTLAEKGDLLFGTIDSFLPWKLTGGQSHMTDMTNASRTMLNIHTFEWDKDLCDLFQVLEQMLPEVLGNTGDFGKTAQGLFEVPIPITGMAGDQQAATVGQARFEKGMAKSTTVPVVLCCLIPVGGIEITHRMLTTIAIKLEMILPKV